jgi:dolichyl-diphosphooligosaccharide--protein glycosyltransferase
MTTAGDVRALIDDRPELEPAVEAVLAADAPFTFDDLAVDSGRFGELVSRGVVEKVDGGYRVADREAVRRGLGADADATDPTRTRSLPSLQFDRSDRLAVAGLLAGLALVAAVRLLMWPDVFRAEHVVFPGNDPYYYRVLVDRLLAEPGATLSSLPGNAGRGEPLLVVALWLGTTLFGGLDAVGAVLALYPVVAAVLTAALVGLVALVVTDDRRVALASVVLLAVLPAHVRRTSVGFADHHAFDYVWLALTLLGVVLVVAAGRHRTADSPPRWDRVGLGVVAVAAGVTGQVLAWEAGPLLVVPLGLLVAADGLRAVAVDESPLLTSGPVVLGVAVAAGLTWLVHATLGWHTTLVAVSPALLAVGGVGVLGAAVATRRLGLPAWALGLAEVAGLVVGALALRAGRPELWARLVDSTTERLLADRAIVEVQSLFGQSLDWLLLFGLLLLVAVPYLLWSLARARTDARWLPLGVYGAYFLVLAVVQVRFAGQLSLLVAAFAGLAFVHLAAWADVTAPPAPFAGGRAPALALPDRSTVRSLVVLFVLVAGLSVVQAPLRTVEVDDERYETATDIEAYSERAGLEYPENYVLSGWGDSRLYNYFVSGEALSYGFARDNYGAFLDGTDGQEWYDRLGGRGFVVTTDAAAGGLVTTMDRYTLGVRLHAYNGSRTEDAPGVGHYRLVATAGDGSHKAFRLVPGAVLRGSAEPNATVTVETRVSVDGTSFTYTRRATAGADGRYEVRVAYPGSYSLTGGAAEVGVNESAVRNGTVVRTGA